MKMKLTQARVDAARAELAILGKSQLVLFDNELAGFGIQIGRSSASAIVDYRDASGRKRRVVLGRVPSELTVTAARKRAAVLRVSIRAGADPAAEKRAARTAARTGLTVSEAIEDWLSDGAATWSPVTLAAYRRAMARDVTPKLGGMLVAELDRKVIMAVITKVKTRSKSSASLLFHIVRAFLGHCDDRGLIEGVSLPRASRVAPRPEPRTRVPSDELLAAIWRASDRLTPRSAAMVRMVLLTAQRRRSVELMRWQDLDFDRGLWRIPAAHMKSRKTHTVSLAPIAIAQLAQLPRRGEYVFGGAKPPGSLNNAIKALKGMVGNAWALHDVRRCLMTWASARGFPRDHAKVAIGHVITLGVDRSYDMHTYQPEAARVALSWQAHIAELIGAPPSAEIITLRAG